MKIYLFLPDKLLTYTLPKEVSGNFGFDFEDDESKLINVVAKDNEWFMYSTEASKIVGTNAFIPDIALKNNAFYVIQKNNKSYLVYVTDLYENDFSIYSYDEKINLSIGNTNGNSIIYNCPYLNGFVITIHYQNQQLLLTISKETCLYINNNRLLLQNYVIQNSDEINLYGLKIIFLNGVLLINKCGNRVILNEEQSKIHKKVFLTNSEPQEIEIKDIDLYNKNNYFSKSPRLRRMVKEAELKISSPPKPEGNDELPAILTVGPMLTMGITSAVTLLSILMRISDGKDTMEDTWPSLVTSGAMLMSMLLWPFLTRIYNKRLKKKKNKDMIKKYNIYLNEKRTELTEIARLQKEILVENLLTTEECLKNIMNRSVGLWDKRIDQSDFLVVRIGVGNELLNVKVSYAEEDFSVEESVLRKNADQLVQEFKYIENVPIGYSFYENRITAIMGNQKTTFMNNMLVQLLSFYSYEDLKFAIFTDHKNKDNWEYMKYLNHTFTNNKSFRFFASDEESTKILAEVLNGEVNSRLSSYEEKKVSSFKPHFLIIIDNYDAVKRFEFIKTITETDVDLGFSVVILEERISKLPSKCNNFITLGTNVSGVLKNSFEKQEQISFKDELQQQIDMMQITKILSNIPIEFEEGLKMLPESINFLEMEKVGRVEQLNILNRWKTNDATTSLKAEVGIDEDGQLLYLDLHEKAHGPHGLIAGMTGSGKSEFIITYILSMAINYSPEDVSFILIDYKGGGLAFAFENKMTGIFLPHLAGTITNLDKAEMDRTLVSIDSEVKRRQMKFNEARDKLGESTIDIYKYQKFYKEGKLEEAIPHLFIVCDEFAELKSQQPDFMDNLISIARIGRSLGIHLILATQKPSGVVTDQIWSNAKFHVCLKVQDEADSKEMLKKPDAASLKQTGRFFLQVGYDEYFVLGQSGWCGAKYYPSDKIEKQVDKSINFIDDNGIPVKSIQAGTNRKVVAEGEQISAIMKVIIDVAKKTGQYAKRLWLENIQDNILVEQIEQKYRIPVEPYHVQSIVGEYDAPERQTQGCVIYNYLENGNTIIYGNDGSEKENLLSTLIYSAAKNHRVNEVNFYIVDYGSESLRRFEKLPHIGGIVYASDDEKYHNLLKTIREELQQRKRLFADYGGEYINYIHNSTQKLPLKVVIFNNYDSIYDANPDFVEDISDLIRDSERYGVIFLITANAINSVHSKISQDCQTSYAFKLKDSSDYQTVFNSKKILVPRDIFGRGLCFIDDIHEFQTAKITSNEEELNEKILIFIDQQKTINPISAEQIQTLPSIVRMEHIQKEITDLNDIPIGISKKDLEVMKIDLLSNCGYLISSNKLNNMNKFFMSLLTVLLHMKNLFIVVLDPLKQLSIDQQKMPNHYIDQFDEKIDAIIHYIGQLKESNSDMRGVIFVYGLNKLINKLIDSTKISELISKLKEYEKASIVLMDEPSKIKSFSFEEWFTNDFSLNDGLWIGKGLSDQSLFHLTTINRDMQKEYKNDMGYVINESVGTLCRLIDFVTQEDDLDEK